MVKKERKFEDYFKIIKHKIPYWEELPEIDLYMDQVIVLMDKYLSFHKTDENSIIITHSMINNYVKQKVIHAPIKKKYRKDHIALLFVICTLKQVYSISDISGLISFAGNTTKLISAYDQFACELENAVMAVFNGDNYEISTNISIEHKLLKSVVLSFANKLYVEKFLSEK
mgnify:CR=1 FL=1